jgi:uncharacterized protein YegP (UPF0339 family)
MPRLPKFETFQGADGQWYWRLVAGNGETVATGEGHTRPEDATRAARTAGRAAAVALLQGTAIGVDRD